MPSGRSQSAVRLLTFFRLSILCSEWVHARTVGPLVDFLDDTFLCSAEESLKLFVRECFVSATRLINGACAWLLALSDSNYKQSLRRAWQQKEAWHSWWREERQSTLNAVLAAQCPTPLGACCWSTTLSPFVNPPHHANQRSARHQLLQSWQVVYLGSIGAAVSEFLVSSAPTTFCSESAHLQGAAITAAGQVLLL